MNRLFTLFLLLTIGTFLSGCGITDSDEKADGIYLRIANASPVEFNSVYVSFPGEETTFERISSGNRSDYQKLDKAYHYGYIKVESEDKTYTLQPVDFVGEEPLRNGKYTYQLNIDGESLTLIFIEN